MLTSALSYSQNWQPKKITTNNVSGIFVPITIMDSISVKLINRKELITQNKRLEEIMSLIGSKVTEQEKKIALLNGISEKYRSERNLEAKNRDLLNEKLSNLRVKNKKIKKRGVLFFSGGFSVASILFLIYK